MLDLGWCGGLSEAKKVAALAELHGVPIAPHDCTGPVGLTAGTHLAISTPNAVLQESVRAFYRGWYRDLVTELPAVVDGIHRAARRPRPRHGAAAGRSRARRHPRAAYAPRGSVTVAVLKAIQARRERS